MKILILGNGQFARLYKEYFISKKYDCLIADGVDIRLYDRIIESIRSYNPDCVINTAAKANLDWCEQNKLECFDNNVLGAETVAQACLDTDKYLVHISTGCMQESVSESDVKKEDDPINPTSFYSWTKAWGDQMIQVLARRKGLKALILRPRQPVSASASRRNALVKMLTFNKFIDTPNSMTVLEDFIEVTEKLIVKKAVGVYNVANPGVMSPLKAARLLKEYINPSLEINEITKEELNKMTYSERIDCVLDCSRLELEGISLKPIEERLREILPILADNLKKNPDAFTTTQEDTKIKLALKKT